MRCRVFAPLLVAWLSLGLSGCAGYDTGCMVGATIVFLPLSLLTAGVIHPTSTTCKKDGNTGAGNANTSSVSGNTPVDTETALKALREGADKGDADAQERLGLLYANGTGVSRDDVQADMWFTLASNAGNTVAAQHLVDLEKRMTQSQIAEVKKLASEWKPAIAAPPTTPPAASTAPGATPSSNTPAASHPQVGPV